MLTSKQFSLALLFYFVLSGLHAQSRQAEQVLAAELRRFEAMVHADTAALQAMLASDLLYVHSNALKENKESHLSAIATRKLVYEAMNREEAMVRFYGKTALVNGLVKVRGVLNGNAFEIRLLYTAVYQKKKGIWQLTNWQSTRVP